ncbi:MAG: 2'-5' RNA ligase family protein [Candidatus Sungiibacteriota bacterium]|uniref:2'-5' RNA ligase family protein n=1 Tax=Candidatus Sungiibacteriota bacterium TaxID=2750080 RepID=A0A7T5UQU2_9BACT|nr:MAG: 2'-5' RNA ligase family protein [Candidatus Sungbacteria bacterium]
MRLLITVRIPKNIVLELDGYRKKYNPSGISHSSAHITLVPPFVLRAGLIPLIKDITLCLEEFGPFRMRIDGLGWFDNRVLFAKSSCPAKLQRLHSLLKKLVQKKHRMGARSTYWAFSKYNPHITLSKDTERNIQRYKKELKGFRYTRTFTVDGVNLCVQRRDGRWILRKEFLFKKRKQKSR